METETTNRQEQADSTPPGVDLQVKQKTIDEVLRSEYESVMGGGSTNGEPEHSAPDENSTEKFMVQLPSGKMVDLSGYPEDVRDELKNGYLRTSDYTRKTQSLADQRREIEEMRSILGEAEKKASLYDHFNSLIGQNPDLYQAIQNAANGMAAGVPEGAFGEGVDESALVSAVSRIVDARMNPIQETLSQLNRTLMAKEEISSLGSRDPLATQLEPDIRQLLSDNPGLSVENAYKIAAHDHLKNKVSSAEVIRRNNASRAGAVAKPGGTEGTPKSFDLSQFPKEKRLEAALSYGRMMVMNPQMRASFNR
jgi:hypothetical protein